MAARPPLALVESDADSARKLPSNLEAEAAFLGAVLIVAGCLLVARKEKKPAPPEQSAI